MASSTNPERPSIFDKKWSEEGLEESTVETYRSINITAIIALIFAILGQLVYINYVFCFLPAIGIVLSLVSVWIIRKSGGMSFGLRLAKISLCLSIVPLVAATIIWPYYNYTLTTQADRFFKMWFQAVREDNIPVVIDLRAQYWARPKHETTEEWWRARYGELEAHQETHHILEQPLLRTLLALGDKAEISYVKTLSIHRDAYRQNVTILYAVTYPKDDGTKESFYVSMRGEQIYNEKSNSLGWALSGIPTDVYKMPED